LRVYLREQWKRDPVDGTMPMVFSICRDKGITHARAIEIMETRAPGTDPIEYLKAWSEPPPPRRPIKPPADSPIYD
jgi:hypothetical protein